jgi:hypothetical protein
LKAIAARLVGTQWPRHHTDLTQHSGSEVRQVLQGNVIEASEAFTGTDIATVMLTQDDVVTGLRPLTSSLLQVL